MTKMNWHIPENLSFEDALELTQTLLDQMVEKKLNNSEIEKIITNLVSSKNGARGFFVIYLTSNLPLADNPSDEVINALKTSPELVIELLVKNLAMSSSMAITHRRNNDEDMAKQSDITCQRNQKLIQKIDLHLMTEELKKLKQTIINNEGIYQTFLEKWGYDDEQKQVIKNNIEKIVS
ncbi:MAG: hypothetical protein QNJ64_11005 [Crocosphaera sp.]|nr:hypothetical protein [Crocosphaera sp.]